MNRETAELLDKCFDTAFTAPDGIKKLRELILTLAMQGRLVPQDPGDPPASELLKEIEAEKKRLVREGKIKNPKPLPPIKPEEIPYTLPKGWEWVRIRDICHDWGQKTPTERFTYIDVSAIDNSSGKVSQNTQILDSIEAPSRARKIVKSGTIIYSTVRPYLLNIAIIDKKYDPEPIASTAFAILDPYCLLSTRFVYYYLRCTTFIRYVESAQKGVAYPAINDGDFFKGLFPLAPGLEQCRIVTKIDQLMARCEDMETLRAEQAKKRLAAHTAATRQLLNTKNQDNQTITRKFLSHHFNDLYTVRENVAELRKAILQLAVMGRLVPQDIGDPPASELLKEIEAEKMRLVREGKIKQPKPLQPIKTEEEPYELPKGWTWVRLSELIELISGQHLSPDEYNEDKIGHSYYTGPANFGAKNPTATRWTTVNRAMAVQGDILLTVKGAGVGKTNVLFEEMAAISRQLMALRVVGANRDYVLRFIETIFYDLQALAIGIAIPGIGRDDVLSRRFPLPPLPEQHRIVTKIDQLMALCDNLEQQIEAAAIKQAELLNALMAIA